MIRADGSRVTTPRHPSWKVEFKGLWIALRTDPFIILLFPMFFASNYFYTWQFSDYNAVLFSIQGRALNNTVYWVAQILGSVSIGLLLDQKQYRRRVRAFLAWAILLCMVMGAHIWAWYYQKCVLVFFLPHVSGVSHFKPVRNYSRESIPPESQKLGIRDPGYIPRLFLYILFGLLDAMWQTTAYWLIGAMSNSPQRLAHFTGFCRCPPLVLTPGIGKTKLTTGGGP